MRRPLVSVAFALAAGVLVSGAQFLSPAATLAGAAAFGLAALILLFLHARSRRIFATALAALVAGGAAFAGSRFADERAPQLCALLSTGTRILHVRGIVRDCPVERTAPRYGGATQPQVLTRFTLDLTQLSDGERWTPIHGRLRAIVRGAAGAQYGDEIEATVRAGRLPPPGNPGEEDVRLFMDRSGICGVAEVRAPEGIRRIGQVCGLPGLRQVFALRSRLLGFLKERMPGDDGRIIRCLVLGDEDAASAARVPRDGHDALPGDQRAAGRAAGGVLLVDARGVRSRAPRNVRHGVPRRAGLCAAERLRARRTALRHHVRRLVRRVSAGAEDGFPFRHGAGAHPDPAHPPRRPLQHRTTALVCGRHGHLALHDAARAGDFRPARRSRPAPDAERRLVEFPRPVGIQAGDMRLAGRMADDGAVHRAALRNVHADRAGREHAAASAAAGGGGRRHGRRARSGCSAPSPRSRCCGSRAAARTCWNGPAARRRGFPASAFIFRRPAGR